MDLSRCCQRNVRVAEFVLGRATSLDGLVEVLYARNVWLAGRVDIWTDKIKFLSVFRHEGLNDDNQADQVDQNLLGRVQTTLQKVEKVEMRMSDRGDTPTLTADELTNILGDVVQSLVDAFKAAQVQALRTSSSPRAKFEYEMLQHLPELEVLVLHRQSTSGCYALFALPLLEENQQWDPKDLLEMKGLDSVYILDSFNAPFFSVKTDGPTILIGFSMMDDEKGGSDNTWPCVVEWPAILRLSSQVTNISLSSEAISSVELIASCKKSFLRQWRRRRDFIAELRRCVIVLEYDAMDFSQVFFMLQEQLNAQAALRIIVLRLEFTTAFFLTNCMSDLRVTLLDGEDGVPPVVALDASSNSHNFDANADCQACVAQFLESTQKGLLHHFYGD